MIGRGTVAVAGAVGGLEKSAAVAACEVGNMSVVGVVEREDAVGWEDIQRRSDMVVTVCSQGG